MKFSFRAAEIPRKLTSVISIFFLLPANGVAQNAGNNGAAAGQNGQQQGATQTIQVGADTVHKAVKDIYRKKAQQLTGPKTVGGVAYDSDTISRAIATRDVYVNQLKKFISMISDLGNQTAAEKDAQIKKLAALVPQLEAAYLVKASSGKVTYEPTAQTNLTTLADTLDQVGDKAQAEWVRSVAKLDGVARDQAADKVIQEILDANPLLGVSDPGLLGTDFHTYLASLVGSFGNWQANPADLRAAYDKYLQFALQQSHEEINRVNGFTNFEEFTEFFKPQYVRARVFAASLFGPGELAHFEEYARLYNQNIGAEQEVNHLTLAIVVGGIAVVAIVAAPLAGAALGLGGVGTADVAAVVATGEAAGSALNAGAITIQLVWDGKEYVAVSQELSHAEKGAPALGQEHVQGLRDKQTGAAGQVGLDVIFAVVSAADFKAALDRAAAAEAKAASSVPGAANSIAGNAPAAASANAAGGAGMSSWDVAKAQSPQLQAFDQMVASGKEIPLDQVKDVVMGLKTDPAAMRSLKNAPPNVRQAFNEMEASIYRVHDRAVINYLEGKTALNDGRTAPWAGKKLKVDDFRTPGADGKIDPLSVNTDRDYRVLYQSDNGEWIEVNRQYWQDVSTKEFANASGYTPDKLRQIASPADLEAWDHWNPAENHGETLDQAMKEKWQEIHQQLATDKYHPEASVDFSDQGRIAGELRQVGQSIKAVKKGEAVLQDAERLGMMYNEKADAYLRLDSALNPAGNKLEAAAQLNKGIAMLDDVREGYQGLFAANGQTAPIGKLSPRFQKAADAIKSLGPFDKTVTAEQIGNVERQLKELGFGTVTNPGNPLKDFKEALDGQFQALKTVPAPIERAPAAVASGGTGGNNVAGGGNTGTATNAPAGATNTTNAATGGEAATGGNAGATGTSGPAPGTATTNMAAGARGAVVAGNGNNAATGGTAQNPCPPNCNEAQLLQAFHDAQDKAAEAQSTLEQAQATANTDQDAMSAVGNAVSTGKASQAALDAAIAKNQASQAALQKAKTDLSNAQEASTAAEQAYDNCVNAKKNCPKPANTANGGSNTVGGNNPGINSGPGNPANNNPTNSNSGNSATGGGVDNSGNSPGNPSAGNTGSNTPATPPVTNPPATNPPAGNQPVGGNGSGNNPAGGSGSGAGVVPGTPPGASAANPQNPCPSNCDEDKLVDDLIAAEADAKAAEEALAEANSNLDRANAAITQTGAALQGAAPASPAYPALQAQAEAAKQAYAQASAAQPAAYNAEQAAIAKEKAAQQALDDCRNKKAQAQKDCPPRPAGTNPNGTNAIGGNTGKPAGGNTGVGENPATGNTDQNAGTVPGGNANPPNTNPPAASPPAGNPPAAQPPAVKPVVGGGNTTPVPPKPTRPPDFKHPMPYVNGNGTTESNPTYTYSGDVTTITKKLQVTICQGDDYVFPSATQEVSIKVAPRVTIPGDTPDATGVPFGSSIRLIGKHVGGNFVEADIVPTDGGPTVHLSVWVHVIDCNTRATAIPSPVNPVAPNPVNAGGNVVGGPGATPPAVTPAGPTPPAGGNGPVGNPAGGSSGGATPGPTPPGAGGATPQNPCPPSCDEDKLVDAVISAEDAAKAAQEALATAEANVKTADSALAAAGAALEATPANSPGYAAIASQANAAKQNDASASEAYQKAFDAAKEAQANQEKAQQALDDCRNKQAQKDCPPQHAAVNPNGTNSIGGGAGETIPVSNGNNAVGGNVAANNASETPAGGLPGNSATSLSSPAWGLGGGYLSITPAVAGLLNPVASLPADAATQVLVVTQGVNEAGPASSNQESSEDSDPDSALPGGWLPRSQPARQTGPRLLAAAYRPGKTFAALKPGDWPNMVIERGSSSSASSQKPIGIPYSIVSNGKSSGDALELQVLDSSGKIKRIGVPEGTVLEPVKLGTAQPVAARPGNGTHLLTKHLNAFCLEFAKLPPQDGMQYRLAPQALQDKYKPVRSVLQAGRELAASGKLHPDSDPAEYADAIRQYALWSQLENWGQQEFTQKFLEHTKKNAAAQQVKWTQQMEQAILGLAPGRWRDVSMVLDYAQKLSGAKGSKGAP